MIPLCPPSNVINRSENNNDSGSGRSHVGNNKSESGNNVGNESYGYVGGQDSLKDSTITSHFDRPTRPTGSGGDDHSNKK
ncbi:hypothetical protein CJF42_25700 [Pseudoalteromonas sp. NBT06-2]|uniref:hypothetical protein n=1 Tax=Pseudoalteromonas sp. NBT06-2 TaxID=2025950 RepID=UPI000BA68E2A|nr:hypothetical protein [Pseudoalteromonas sp. NBT06-2]PAJ71627.1 hypothetical protein CJF42_25700 [Pseudoalteromonas sp. NBT06-2]